MATPTWATSPHSCVDRQQGFETSITTSELVVQQEVGCHGLRRGQSLRQPNSIPPGRALVVTPPAVTVPSHAPTNSNSDGRRATGLATAAIPGQRSIFHDSPTTQSRMTCPVQAHPARPTYDKPPDRFVRERSGARYAVLILIAATLVGRMLFGFCFGLGIDESYTVATGRHPQLSTFDHPPAAWWLAWGASRLFATESALVLRLPFILLFAVTTWLTYRLTAYLFDERAGFWAAATLNLAPVIAWTSGTWIVPDGPLNAALMAATFATAKAVFGPRRTAPPWWLAAGGCGGLSLLSKFHGIFLFAGV